MYYCTPSVEHTKAYIINWNVCFCNQTKYFFHTQDEYIIYDNIVMKISFKFSIKACCYHLDSRLSLAKILILIHLRTKCRYIPKLQAFKAMQPCQDYRRLRRMLLLSKGGAEKLEPLSTYRQEASPLPHWTVYAVCIGY